MWWLPWEYGLVLAGLLVIVAWRIVPQRPGLAAIAREAAVIAALYSLWQFAGQLSVLGIDDAISRGEWIWDFERALRLPDELVFQNWVRPSSFWTQFSNLYYAIVHVPLMGVFLLWLFLRHRESYPTWRNALALTTGACLVIQLLPVAPPRLTEYTGMIDTGLEYGQSVYGTLGYGIAGQLQAMPSIHVAWAAIIGWAVWEVSTSPWRWVGPMHFTITFLVVAITGNHYWLDGLVAMVLLVGARWLGARLARWTDRRPEVEVIEEPVAVTT